MTKDWNEFERYFSECVKEDTAKLAEAVQKEVDQNWPSIHPFVLASIPGVTNIISTAISGAVMDLLKRYHEWSGEKDAE